MTQPTLNRTLSLFQLVLYGTGTILGAGIYVLVGEVAASSGTFSALAFMLAGIIVAFSAYSFATLSRRFPVSAGEAAYVQAAFNRNGLSTLVGYSIVFMGITSSATIAQGFYGYLAHFIDLPNWLVSIAFVSALTWIATRTVGFAIGLAVAATVIEITGLGLVIFSAHNNLGQVIDNPQLYFLPTSTDAWWGVGIGAYLAFYACIGFEDMVNMAEEVKNPGRNMPLGIAIVLVVTTLLYILVTLAALTSLPLEVLARSHAPLALVIEKNGVISVGLIAIISAIAVTNGALIQIIMGARVLYGMGTRQLAPGFLAKIHGRTQIPHRATLVVGALVLAFTLALPMATLARTTSTIVLSVFTLVNIALLVLNWRGGYRRPLELAMPLLAALLCTGFMAMQSFH